MTCAVLSTLKLRPFTRVGKVYYQPTLYTILCFYLRKTPYVLMELAQTAMYKGRAMYRKEGIIRDVLEHPSVMDVSKECINPHTR